MTVNKLIKMLEWLAKNGRGRFKVKVCIEVNENLSFHQEASNAQVDSKKKVITIL